ncbi:helix-turn-helix transcriptional regulator [Clostridium sp. DL1XJH146]
MELNTREDLINIVSKKIRLIRTEYNFSQEKMADILGVSKKTLIQIEKGRTLAGWTVIVAICGLFRDSEILKMILGDDSIEILETITFGNIDIPRNVTGGGKIWWKIVVVEKGFKVQKNIISGHYRIIDGFSRRWYSSMSEINVQDKLKELILRGDKSEEEN